MTGLLSESKDFKSFEIDSIEERGEGRRCVVFSLEHFDLEDPNVLEYSRVAPTNLT